MSGAPKNVQRDGFYADLDNTNDVTWATDSSTTSNTLTVSGPAAVQVDIAHASADSTSVKAIAASNRTAIGVYIQAPIGDRTPYRVKASVGAQGGHTEWAIGVGYAPASPTGTNDSVVELKQFPFTREFDDLIFIEPEAEGDTYEDRALCFAVICQGNGSGVGDYYKATISVQNLGVIPPTMQNAVS